ncbi:MAG: hypothetical protein E7201_09520 [Selenomonas ruminantium]|uniref:Type IV pilus biogenesis protein PilP n=1 Tax=Selenomonas ruminantium TaxID=971 RepID=A0A927WT10_SELRU|nr:hypothetical protein [Selenomonas ruminantium]
MEFRLEKWYRPLAGCGLFLLLAGLAGAWYADEAEKPPLVLQADEGKEKVVQEDSLAIRGLQEANEQKELRNPFSMLHETEQESEHMDLPAKQPMENGKAKTDKSLAVSPAAGNGSQMPAGNEPAISLCGIVEGGGQRLALLKVGNNTVTAGLGEMVSDWQVTGISAAAVTVERSGQVQVLPLVMNGEAGAK